MTKDPVCGESVEVQRHTPKQLHKGVIYHFCSEDCKQEFKTNPSEHVGRSRQAGAYP